MISLLISELDLHQKLNPLGIPHFRWLLAPNDKLIPVKQVFLEENAFWGQAINLILLTLFEPQVPPTRKTIPYY